MEILNSLWNVLTTENEMMTKIINAPTVIIELWLAFVMIKKILHIKTTPKQGYIYIILLSIICLITEFFVPTPINVIINYVVMFIIIKYVFKLNNVKTILCTIFPTVLYALVGVLILKPILILFKISAQHAQNTPIYELLYLSLLYTIIFILIKFICYLKLKIILNEEFNEKNKKIIMVNLIFGFFTLSVQLAITAFYTDVLPINITICSVISLFAYFSINFYSLNKTMKLQETTKSLETAENYNETLSYLYDNVKAFQHDFNNMIFIIGGYIEANDTEGLKKYYKNLEKDCERVNNVALLNPKLINNSGIYNLLMSKYKKANEKNVEIKLEFFFDFEKLKMPIYDFSRILGILLDNAIEAAKETEEKYVSILFRDSNRNKTQIISIENTYKNKEIDTTRIFEKGVTEKNEHMGMGLWEIKQILKRNNNVNLITTKDEIYFKQNLEIYY